MTISQIPDRQLRKSPIPCPYFGQFCFPVSHQIPDPVKIFIVFLIPAPYFGHIPDPKNKLPDRFLNPLIITTNNATILLLDKYDYNNYYNYNNYYYYNYY